METSEMNDLKKELETIELDELLKAINDFTALARERELTIDESAMRQLHREEYIQRIRRNLRSTLDNTDIEFADGDDDGSNC